MIYADKILTPTYLVADKNDKIYHVSATKVEVDIEHGIVLFYNGKSADTMFRIEDVKMYARII